MSEQPMTGVSEVDDVLRDVRTVGDRPIDEQATVLEDAHQRLRQVLDAG